ncbi:hypothetical protein ACB098_06G072300 [Castanea mollissima]
MKIQCNVCEAAEATVLCCADEAALCWACDEKVHAANKLASKHQRVPLSTSHMPPNCDICQETAGYFFCLEDRALLCRKLKSQSGEENLETKSHSVSRRDASLPMAVQCNKVLPIPVGGVGDFAAPKVPYSGGNVAGSILQWPIDEYLGLPEFNQSYGYMDNGSSKADSSKLGETDSPILRAAEEELDDDECLGQVPEASWTVPQITSPPTASGLYWPKNYQNSLDGAVFVPDVCHLHVQNPQHCQHNGTISKRWRQI